MGENIPKNHHFVPQFILRNFTYESNNIYLYKLDSKELSSSKIMYKYSKPNLYKSLNENDIMYIERKFSELENKASKIISNIIHEKQRIFLNKTDLYLLKKFFFLLDFRSEKRRNQYKNANFDYLTKVSLGGFVSGENYLDLWIRELKYLLDNDVNEITTNKNLSTIIAMDFNFFFKDTFMVIWNSCQSEDFILTDNYGTFEFSKIFLPEPTIRLFPISPKILVGFVSVFFNLPKSKDLLNTSFDRDLFKPPTTSNNSFKFEIIRVNDKNVIYTNILLLNEVVKYFSFFDYTNIFHSIKAYQEFSGKTKHDYSKLLTWYD